MKRASDPDQNIIDGFNANLFEFMSSEKLINLRKRIDQELELRTYLIGQMIPDEVWTTIFGIVNHNTTISETLSLRLVCTRWVTAPNSLSECTITQDEELECLRLLPLLQCLTINASVVVSNVSFQRYFSKLTKMVLMKDFVTSPVYSFSQDTWRCMKDLKVFDITRLPEFAFQPVCLKFLKNLTSLKLGNNYRHVTVANLSNLVNLKVLDIRNRVKWRNGEFVNMFGGYSLPVLTSMKSLELLKVSKYFVIGLPTNFQSIRENHPSVRIRLYYYERQYYEGDFDENTPHGKGVYVCRTWKYTGDYLSGKRHGKGIFCYGGSRSGVVYEGEFKDNLKDGLGVLRNKNGILYQGEWKDGKKNGKGTLSFQNVNCVCFGQRILRYEGEFKDDLFGGNGIYYFNTVARYEGVFEKGKIVGEGSLYDNENNLLLTE